MVARRSLNGSLTVVGARPGHGCVGQQRLGRCDRGVPEQAEPRVAGLSVGYRIPGPTMMLANRISVRRAGVAPPNARAVRRRDPQLAEVRDSLEALVRVVALAKVGGRATLR